jgi:hypothetical protein
MEEHGRLPLEGVEDLPGLVIGEEVVIEQTDVAVRSHAFPWGRPRVQRSSFGMRYVDDVIHEQF